MKAKQLIEELQKINPEAEIIIREDEYGAACYISDIYSPRKEDNDGLLYSIGETGTYDGDPLDI